MKDETTRLTSRFFIFLILALILSYFLASIITFRVYRPKPEEISKAISQMDLDSQELSFSGYTIEKYEPYSYLTSSQDITGQTYYIRNSNSALGTILLGAIISVIILGIITHILVSSYRDYMRNKALRPISRLTEVVTDILSGTSKEADLDNVIDDIKPLIDQNKVSKERLENSITKLFKAEKNRREFTANVTHELKTPLTSINGYAEMIASGFTSEEDTVRFANIILTEGNRLLNMIDEIIRLSQYESQDSSDLDYDFIDLADLVGRICYEMQTYARTKDIELSYSLQNVNINADPSMIYEMVTNLVSNAIKYNTPPGKVVVTVKEAYLYAVITVKDDGIGISEENQERIFERFYMVNRNSKKSSGTGLGLSLVKHIVESHDGIIDVYSELGVGSTFVVKLPMRINPSEDPAIYYQ